MLGDYLSTGLGALGLSWQSAPALAELEEVVTDWMRQLVGLPETFKGVIQDTASTSTLVALICAREKASDFSLGRGGLAGLDAPLVVYGSAHAHSSVDKAALLAGFGRDNLRHVETDAAYAIRPEALQAAIRADLAAGRAARRRGRQRRHDGRDGDRPGRRDRRDRHGARAVAACRCRDGGLGDDPAGDAPALGGSRATRIRWCSIRTNGSARRSTARSTTCAIPSTSCA